MWCRSILSRGAFHPLLILVACSSLDLHFASRMPAHPIESLGPPQALTSLPSQEVGALGSGPASTTKTLGGLRQGVAPFEPQFPRSVPRNSVTPKSLSIPRASSSLSRLLLFLPAPSHKSQEFLPLGESPSQAPGSPRLRHANGGRQARTRASVQPGQGVLATRLGEGARPPTQSQSQLLHSREMS